APGTIAAEEIDVMSLDRHGEVITPCGALNLLPEFSELGEAGGMKVLDLMDAARTCDDDRLIEMARQDSPALSFGVLSPEDAFAIPGPEQDVNRYEMLTRLLATTPGVTGEDSGLWRWPAEPTTDAQWADLVEREIVTQNEVDAMREAGAGYVGYRVVVGEDGTWHAFIAGD
ncbi:MAG: hypothetical protein Q4G67_12320, partial [Actinomycetia bacterium]|nr:hypothetical protein [Actinomycetes bacterium]